MPTSWLKSHSARNLGSSQDAREILATFSLRNWRPGKNDEDLKADCRTGPPTQIGCWSRQAEGTVTHGSAVQCGSFRLPPRGSDLFAGYPDDGLRKHGAAASADLPLAALLRSGLALDNLTLTYRNNLNKIFMSRVSPESEWTVDACLVEGLLALDIVTKEDDPPPEVGSFPDKCSYAGYRFEALATGREQADCTSEYCTVSHMTLGSSDPAHRPPVSLVVAAEIDCCFKGGLSRDGAPPPAEALIELKTTRAITEPRHDHSMRRWKFPKWWLQAYLAGVPTVAVGFRGDDGSLADLTMLRTADLPAAAEGPRHGKAFNPWEVVAFGRDVLHWMRQTLESHGAGTVRFRHLPGDLKHPGAIQAVPQGDNLMHARLQALIDETRS